MAGRHSAQVVPWGGEMASDDEADTIPSAGASRQQKRMEMMGTTWTEKPRAAVAEPAAEEPRRKTTGGTVSGRAERDEEKASSDNFGFLRHGRNVAYGPSLPRFHGLHVLTQSQNRQPLLTHLRCMRAS